MILKFLLRFLVVFVLIVAVGCLPSMANTHLIFEDTFNSGSFQPYADGTGWNQTQFTATSQGEIVSTPTRAGSGAARFTLTYPDRRVEKNKFAAGRPGVERWFGFSTYIPEDWPDHDNFTIVTQIKGSPDSNEPNRSPFLSIELRNGQWGIFSRWDANAITKPGDNGNGGTIQSAKVYEGPYEKGAWTDWVVHAKWSYEEDGLLEIWQNNEQVVNRPGPNCYNDTEHGFHFKIGMYKPGYREDHPSPLVLFHDTIRIGDETAQYDDVFPGV
ncbi:MAG: polysaccharide lyase [Cyanobacteria bacterium P01_E01_bin.6]